MNKKPAIFKPAESNNGIWNLTKTLLQTAVFWLVFLYVIPLGILQFETLTGITGFEPQKEVSWILFVLFSCIGIYSGYTMSWIGKGTPLPLDCPNKLVIKGPYKFVRNPMALAGIGQGICVGIIWGSFLIIIYSISGAILWHVMVRPMEEKDLEYRFGKSYLAYKKRVRCWIPNLGTKQK